VANGRDRDKTPLQLLVGAREVLANKGWCQRALARNAEGESVYEDSSKAVSFCMIGALQYAGGKGFDTFSKPGVMVRGRLRRAITALYSPMGIERFNDTEGRTKEEVLAVFDAAIKREKQ
jgi:hypothetical protein